MAEETTMKKVDIVELLEEGNSEKNSGYLFGHSMLLRIMPAHWQWFEVRGRNLMDDLSAAGYIQLRPDDDYVILEFPALDIEPGELDTMKIADYLSLISLKASRDIV
ncbi:hypothetical protein [Planococcus lenghuensis]|uniref:Uncharacterized protein n=1 Tax=Planococcus lenghuensis TaxID=2213202 RepID=A0A1Q2L4C4_9BACL|nr:hypothetical protein [Planococcus lenghuensis]AQQ55273.1 hypothetical protein B0X71_19015 [Planococcus lenghuensis]